MKKSTFVLLAIMAFNFAPCYSQKDLELEKVAIDFVMSIVNKDFNKAQSFLGKDAVKAWPGWYEYFSKDGEGDIIGMRKLVEQGIKVEVTNLVDVEEWINRYRNLKYLTLNCVDSNGKIYKEGSVNMYLIKENSQWKVVGAKEL